jgi:hypothetical protein
MARRSPTGRALVAPRATLQRRERSFVLAGHQLTAELVLQPGEGIGGQMVKRFARKLGDRALKRGSVRDPIALAPDSLTGAASAHRASMYRRAQERTSGRSPS